MVARKAAFFVMKGYQPPHLYLDNLHYFITCRTFDHQDFFAGDCHKKILLNAINESVKQLKISLIAYVVLDNHYHLMIYLKRGAVLPKLMQLINGRSSRRLKSHHASEGRLISLPSGRGKVWRNYWDHGIRDEKDFWSHFNYIHHNPVKHGYTKRNKDYQFSSHNYWLKRKGREWVNSCFECYPIIDFTPNNNQPKG